MAHSPAAAAEHSGRRYIATVQDCQRGDQFGLRKGTATAVVCSIGEGFDRICVAPKRPKVGFYPPDREYYFTFNAILPLKGLQ